MNRHHAILIAAAAAFFALTAWLAAPPGGVWNSPDEAANAFWTSRFAAGEPLMLRDVAVGLGRGAVHPRSFAVYGDALVPGSFPGLVVIYGSLAFLTGLPAWVFAPFLTAVAGACLYALTRRLFDDRTALVSALLFYAHPAVLYFSARGLYHNMLFVDLLIFAAATLVFAPKLDVLGGAVFGLALATRSSETPWALLSALAFVPLVARKDRWRRVGLVAAGAALPLFVQAYLNSALYGAPLRTGYVAPEGDGALVFGLHPRLIIRHVVDYGLGLFWWFALPAAAGLAAALAAVQTAGRAQRTYLAVTLLVTAWLAAFYGSWQIADRFNPDDVTIGTSYVRYFLPAYVLTIPFAAQGLLRAAQRVPGRRRLLTGAAVATIAALSLCVAVFRGDEALLAVRTVQRANVVKKALLLRTIPEDAVVMTDRFDKLLFPERHRLIPVRDEASFQAAASLAAALPVYWYGLDPSDQELLELKEAAVRHGLVLGEPTHPVPGEALMTLSRP